MKIHKRTILSALMLLLLVLSRPLCAQQVAENDEWVFTESYGVPVWIGYNEIIDAAAGSRREMYIFIEPHNFTPESIKKLFASLATEKTPEWLEITVFSDKGILQRAINKSTSGVSMCWVNTPEGIDAATKWAEKNEPSPTGYYRASYSRIARYYLIPHKQLIPWYTEESYDYSPDPAKPETVTVVIQGEPSSPPYTGDKDTDLLMAAAEGDAIQVRALVKKGANLNTKDDSGSTPLKIAAFRSENLEIVNFLLAKGADVNARDDKGDTALICAAMSKEAVILQSLLDKGADINHQDDGGYSALIMSAARDNSLKPLKMLLARGADPEARDTNGDTALIKASANGAAEMVKALLKKGANVHARGKQGGTPLLAAASTGKPEIVKLILSKGADVNDRNQSDVTPLMVARDRETVRVLISKGADVNAKDDEGKTALMYAAKLGNTEIAKLLLDRGIDPTTKNKLGETAINITEKSYINTNAMLDLLESAERSQNNSETGETKPGMEGDHSTNSPEFVARRDPNAQYGEVVSSVAFSPDGKKIASKLFYSGFASDNGIIIWDAETGDFIKGVKGPPINLISVAFSPDGKEVLSQHGNAWNIENGQQVDRLDTLDTNGETAVYCAAFSIDGKIAAIAGRRAGEQKKVTIREAKTNNEIRCLATGSDVTELRLSADSKTLVGALTESALIRVWDVDTGDVKQEIKLEDHVVHDLALSSDGKMVAVATNFPEDHQITVFDTSTGKTIHALNDSTGLPFSLAFSPDGSLLASTSDKTVKIWDAGNGKLLHELDGHTLSVPSVAFSSDSRLLVSGGGNNETKVWSASTGKLLVTLKAYNDGNWISYTPDGFYNCSKDGSKYVSFRMGKNLFGAAKYEGVFFRPEVIAARIRELR